ncbi:MAG: hypothetical protein MPK31_08605 [Gammaproteobacteria bacterium]|nr:hypothetical protein [Gammaproteobacteria bacterium]
MSNPNIFRFATSELSQDAALAYMLAWASLDYAKVHPDLHDLGVDFLCALLDRTDKKSPAKIEKVDVKTQENRVDVSVVVNGKIFLILEDKTNTNRHNHQIRTYVAEAKERGKSEKESWKDDIRPIYIKTGDESPLTRKPTEAVCKELGGGHFYRDDLLDVLNKHTKTGDAIIDQFRDYLESWKNSTEIFEKISVEKWDWRAQQGYYHALEQEDVDCAGWDTVNQAGEHAFWTNGEENKEKTCALYLQIDGNKSLAIRCAARPEDGKTKITPEIREKMYERIEKCLSQPQFSKIEIFWKGRAGGLTATVVQVSFGGKDTYMVFNSDGVVDMPATVENLKKAVELVKESCK